MSAKIPAVAYYRMSSDKQETSIGDQRTAVEQYAADRGYRIVREYLDEGISGWKSEQRKGFQRLIDDAQNRCDFKAVLCWDQDRFSRFDPLEANHYWFLLDRAGVHLATVAQGKLDWRDLGGWLSASVVQHGKAQYCKDLARNVARGLRRVKLAGRWFGIAPLGYRIVEGKLELAGDDEVAAVRRIFDMRVGGAGYYTISKALNASGVPTPNGGRWQANSIRQMLNRKTYLGHTIVGKHSRSTHGRVVDEPVTLENTHEAIVDKKTWDAVQAIKGSDRRAHTRNGSNGAPLAGLCYCGLCGSSMYAVSGNLYVCGGYHSRGVCGFCNVKREPLLAAVAAKIRAVVLMGSPDRLEAAIQRELDRRTAKRSNTSGNRRKLEQLDTQIERAADRLLIVDDSLVDDLQARLIALKLRREKLAATIEVAPASGPVKSAKAIAAKVWELDRILTTAPPEAVRNALESVVERVTLNFEPGKETRCRKPYRFTGGQIRFRTTEVISPR